MNALVSTQPQFFPEITPKAVVTSPVPEGVKPPPGHIHPLAGIMRKQQGRPFTFFLEVDPLLASEMLKWNYGNRKKVPDNIDNFARDMVNSKWHLSNDAITFARDGQLLNGQNRLYAIIKANTTITVGVMINFDKIAQSTMDNGRKRTFTHALQILGYDNPDQYTASMRLILRHFHNLPQPTLDEMESFIPEYAPDIQAVYKILKGAQYMGSAVVIAALAVFRKADPEKIDLLARQIRTGDNIQEGDPAKTIRKYFTERKNERRVDRRGGPTGLFLKLFGPIYAALNGRTCKVMKPNWGAFTYACELHDVPPKTLGWMANYFSQKDRED